MTATVSRFSHSWAAGHRLLLAVVALTVALAASVAIAVMTPAGSSPSAPVESPARIQPGPQNQGQPDDLNRVRVDLAKRCAQRTLVAC